MSLRDAYHARSAELGRAIRPDTVLPPVESRALEQVQHVERRDPQAATTLTRYLNPGQAQVPEWDAETAIRQAYLIDVVVARCTQIRAQTIASVPFRAGADPAKPGDTNPDAPLARLLGPAPFGPAPRLSSQVWWEWAVAQRILTGRWGSEIETDTTGTPIALWPLASAYLRAVPAAGGADWWAGFTYGNDGRTPKKLNADKVLYGWDPSPLDFREPYSVLQSARLAVSVAVMAGRYNYSFLRNDARPAAVIVTEEFASDEEFRKFKSSWGGEYGGPDNAGKMRFLEADPNKLKPAEALNVFPLGISQRDARLIEQEKAALEHIAIAMGVPWSKLDASGRTFDNASQEDQSWWESTILPDLTKFADEINIQLAPRLGKEVGWFDLSNVRALRPRSKFSTLKDGLEAWDRGIVVTDEIRSELDLAPVAGGDVLTPRQLAALEAPPVPPALAPSTVSTTASAPHGEQRALLVHTHAHAHSDGTLHSHEHSHAAGTPDHSHFAQIPHSHAHPVALAAPVGEQRTVPLELDDVIDVTSTENRGPSPEDIEARRARIWRSTDAALTALEKRWTKSMRRLFDRQSRAVLSRLEGNRGRRVIEQRASAGELFDRDHWLTETIDDTAALYELVATAAFTRLADSFGIAFDIEAPYAQDFIQARAKQLAGQVTDTTYDAIKQALADGVAEGEAIPDLANRIRHVFDVASDARATTIARTEVISAYGGSTRLAGNEMPDDVLGGFEWISTRDARTRDAHDEADGQVIERDGAFNVDGEPLAYPGDPGGSAENVINCRCALASLTPAEMEGRARPPSIERRAVVDAAARYLLSADPTELRNALGQPFDDELARRRNQRSAA